MKHSDICFGQEAVAEIFWIFWIRIDDWFEADGSFYLVTEGDFSMTDRRTLVKEGMSSADSGIITSSGWVIFIKTQHSSVNPPTVWCNQGFHGAELDKPSAASDSSPP